MKRKRTTILRDVPTNTRKTAAGFLREIPVKIILPAVLTVILFVGTIFWVILPIMESSMMADKREMIRELTETAWSALAAFEREARSGRLTPSEAQRRAVEHLRHYRYGEDFKDYFWINDMHPRIIMHPYRPDLEGRDCSDFTDPNGKRLFVAFVEMVRRQDAGFVDYEWQWKDDPGRIVPKISYVKAFEPWGWIVGTGIYIEDVRQEIDAITGKLLWVCAAILFLISVLSGYIIWQAVNAETDRFMAERALVRSEEQYRLLAETMREFIIAFDPEGGIAYTNRAWEARSGYSREEMETANIYEIIPENLREEFRERISSRIDGDTAPDLFETQFRLKGGRSIPVEVASALSKDRDGRMRLFITARDVTEKKEAEARARIHQEQLFQASKMASLGTLVSGVAHEINNPIMSVMMNAPILKEVWRAALPVLDAHCETEGEFYVNNMGYSLLRDRVPVLLENIHDGARRVKTIVADLKDFARPDPSHETGAIDANQVLRKSVGLVENLIKKSTNHFSVDYGEPLPPVTGNAQRIEQVIINLLVNACQAISDKALPISAKTFFDAPSGAVCVEIRDTGVGMSEAVLRQIRDPFFTTKRDSGGTGLGLSISERIIEDHGGSMVFASAPGEGTTVTVRLPTTRLREAEGR